MKDKKQKILLIEPPFNRLYHIESSLDKLPLSLGYLAAMIRANMPSWEVQIYNADFSPHSLSVSHEYLAGEGHANYRNALKDPGSPIWKEIEDTIRRTAPSIVGITAKSQTYGSACNIARIAKSIDSSILVVLGGPHVSLVKGEVLRNLTIDVGVSGEGEETIVEILDSFEGHKPLSAIKGIVYREGEDVVETEPREYIRDLDTLPFPISAAEDCLIDFEKYPRKAFKNLFAVRGCPYNCSFCGSRYIWGRKVRFRSADNIVAEIKELQKLGIDYVHFSDDTWGVKESFIHELCASLEKDCPGLSWSCEMHVNLVKEETIALMKSAGCQSIQIGVESGNDEMLKLVKKNITIEKALLAARTIKRHKIHLETFFIVGFPQETEESLSDTISAITSMPTDLVIYSIFTPYFGTDLFEYCRREGIVSDDHDVSLYNHQSPDNYFCPKIPQDTFKARLRGLESKLDKINGRKKIKRYLSKEGLLKFKERGLRHGSMKLVHICLKALKR